MLLSGVAILDDRRERFLSAAETMMKTPVRMQQTRTRHAQRESLSGFKRQISSAT
jgi:hypothetical protein